MNSIGTPAMWAIFGGFALAALTVDLLAIRGQGDRAVSITRAGVWTAVWFAVAGVFCAWLWWTLGGAQGDPAAHARTFEFVTGYLVEKALAVDNVFVFLMLFGYFAVPPQQQSRALTIGILGALVLRAIVILAGAWLIAEFAWLLYVFGAFLVFTGVKMWIAAGEEPDLDNNPALAWIRRRFRIAPDFDGDRLFTVVDGVRMATPLAAVVALIGIVDVIFAVDSIPAIFAITTDPYIVLTSNVFAILGLRPMYFLLARMKEKFHLLSYGLAIVLAIIGVKMLIVDVVHIPVVWSLAATLAILAATMLLSLALPPGPRKGGAYPFRAKKPADPKPD
jgi:tellurite resistance protein TerC